MFSLIALSLLTADADARPYAHVVVGGPHFSVVFNPWSAHARPAPRHGWIWVDGYWSHGDWRPGHWVPSYSRPGYAWVNGYWSGHSWTDGYWRDQHRDNGGDRHVQADVGRGNGRPEHRQAETEHRQNGDAPRQGQTGNGHAPTEHRQTDNDSGEREHAQADTHRRYDE